MFKTASGDYKIKLPKGTKLYNFETKNNKNRDYRWYYMVDQKFNDIHHSVTSDIKNYYTTVRDIDLNIQCCKILDRTTSEIMTTPDTYDCVDYYHDTYCEIHDLQEKNTNIEKYIPCVTRESVDMGINNPLTGIMFHDPDGDWCDIFEIVLNNDDVKIENI